MTTWITADLHFGHANILKFNPDTRPFADAADMNEQLIKQWNESVRFDDLTYIVGDVAFCTAEKAAAIVRRLNGKKILIQGNHDFKLLKELVFTDCFEEIHMYHEITFEKTKVCMFHYPISEWNQCHRGSVHCFGHQHGNGEQTKFRSMDVGMDATGNIVSNLSDVVNTLLKKPMQGHH